MKHLLSVLLIVLLWNLSSSAQTFIDVSNATGFSVLSQSSGWGNGVSFFDVDEDGWDDLTVCVAGAPTRFYKNNSGSFELHTVFFNDQESKACIWLDIDEDGDNDLFVSRFNAADQLYLNQGELIFEDVTSNISNLHSEGDYSWGVSFGDYTRDGFLDICVGNYGVEGAPNVIARNTGQSSFQLQSIEPVSNTTKTSFQPIWMDLNQDLYQDLFTINDHSQGNEYYVQHTPGFFEDKSLESGLFAPASSMSNSWCDFDRDGDLDVYITNTIQGNLLMVNNGENIFTDNAMDEGVVLNAWSWSALWIDADNDGWEDLHVASKNLAVETLSDNFFFKNDSGNFVSQLTSGLANNSFGGYASAKGDFNNDGLSDIVLVTEQNEKYKLFQNTTSTPNNYFKFRLKGRLSNRNGIGTRYEYWIDGEKRIGYTYCGEGYLTQNSQNILLGLGSESAIDSIKFYWISGVEDVHYNLAANTFQVFIEGETKSTIVSSKDAICDANDNIQLSITGWPVVMWDNGSFNPNRIITSAGTYTAIVSTGYGHSLTMTKTIGIEQIPSVVISENNPSCFNAADGSFALQWSSDSTYHALQYSDLTAGVYVIPLNYGQDCTTEMLVELINPEPLLLESVVQSASCFGSDNGSVSLTLSGGTQPYSFGSGSNYVISELIAGNYSGVLSDSNGCEVTWNASIDEPAPLILGASSEMPSILNDGSIVLSVNGGVEPYSYQWNNGVQIAENLNLQAGNYAVQVTDSNGCTADTTFSLIFNYVQPLNLNTMIWTLHKDGLHYDGSETLHHVFVYDAVGRLLHREQIMSGHTTIPMDANGPLFILSHEGNWKSSISLE
ncbi:MAG: hypothetical protein RJA38_1287 [Bacteroidota bacterium]|jgi:hypothetical protein